MKAFAKERLEVWALGVLVFLASMTAFLPALDNGFVDFDDGIFIRDNPWIRGLGAANMRWMLTAVKGGLWHPLVWLSFALDYRAWGLEPSGFHCTNIVLHAVAAVLFYFVCLRLFRLAGAKDAVVGAALSALFFSVHPLRVESVAWAAERKDVLSGIFVVAALLFRLKAVESGRKLWNAAGAAALALSLAAKPAGLMLSPALAILEVYPLRRLPVGPWRWRQRAYRPIWSELSPFFVLSAAAVPVTIVAARLGGALQDTASRGLSWRVGQAAFRILFYPLKTVWPAALSPFYPPKLWFGSWSWELFACAGLAAAVAAVVGRFARRAPALAAAFAIYAVLLLPMLGLVQSGMAVSACDRYSYLPCLGFALMFGAAFSAGRARRAAAAAWLIALGCASWTQCGVWRDSVTLWSSAYERGPGEVALSNLAGVLVDAGRVREAEPLLERAISLYPRFDLNYGKLGVIHQSRGDEAGARAVWRRGLAQAPTEELAAHLGMSLAQGPGRDLKEGIGLLRSAVLQAPGVAPWRAELAQAYARAGLGAAADREFFAAVSLDPQLGRAWNNWGLLLSRAGRPADAVLRYRAALCDVRTRAQANHNLGNLLLDAGRPAEAERHFREALRIDPGLAEAQVNLGNILAGRGSYAEAAARYRAALKSAPGLPQAKANLAAVAGFLR